MSPDTTPDGVIFDYNLIQPSGSGVFEPFVRIEAMGSEEGYNSVAGPDLDTKMDMFSKTSFTIGDLQALDGNYVFELDANEPGSTQKKFLDLTDIQVFLSPLDNLNSYDINTGKLDGLDPIYSLDNSNNGDTTVTIDASMRGSGTADMSVLIPTVFFTGSLTDYVYFYSSFDRSDSGYEEWRALMGDNPSVVIPEPSTYLFLGSILGLVAVRRRSLKLDVARVR
jgi:hypothetical protein